MTTSVTHWNLIVSCDLLLIMCCEAFSKFCFHKYQRQRQEWKTLWTLVKWNSMYFSRDITIIGN